LRSQEILPPTDEKVKDHTGLEKVQLMELATRLRDEIQQSRWSYRVHVNIGGTTKGNTLNTISRLYLVLSWLKTPICYEKFVEKVVLPNGGKLSASYLSREIRHILPIIRGNVHEISIEDAVNIDLGVNLQAAGAIDVCNALCNRMHPGQSLIYRGDVG
jgi:hypothetical protein